MRLAIMLLAFALLPAEDAYVAWWRRVDADVVRALAGGDRIALAGARKADPPPVLPLGDAVAHQLVLLAWLNADVGDRPALAATLAAVRAHAHASLRLVDPALPLNQPPAGGAQPRLLPSMVAGSMADCLQHELADGDAITGQALALVEEAATIWTTAPATAEERAGEAEGHLRGCWAAGRVLSQGGAPALGLRADLDAYRALLTALEPRLVTRDDGHPRLAAGDALILRTARACGPDYAALAVWIGGGCGRAAEFRPERIRHLAERWRSLSAGVRQSPALAGLVLPQLAEWGARRAVARPYGWTSCVQPALRVAAWHVSAPAEAAAADQAFLAAIEQYCREVPAVERMAQDSATDGWQVGVLASLPTTIERWEAMAGMWNRFNAEEAPHTAMRRLDADRAGEIARVAARLKQLVAPDPVFHQAFPQLGEMANDLEMVYGKLADAAAAQVQIARRVQGAADAEKIRDEAMRSIAAHKHRLALGQRSFASLVAACGGPTDILGLAPTLGCGDGPGAAPADALDPMSAPDAALVQAAAGPWSEVAAALIVRRRQGDAEAELRGLWQRLVRRRSFLHGIAGSADAEAIAADLRREGATISAGLMMAPESAPVGAAVESWFAAIRGAAPHRVRGGPPEGDIHLAIAIRMADAAPPGWSVLVRHIFEAAAEGKGAAALGTDLALAGIDLSPRQAELAEDFAEFAMLSAHPVAAALARLAASGQRDPAAFAATRAAIVPRLEAYLAAQHKPEVR